ncbi:MAG: HDOD domain-containing protein [Deltaproteobacteria bacterium]|nr:HDOD domain-containing protein [Deltaproteobacteria bacterium]
MDTKTFLKKLDDISDIPTLPTVALKVNRMLEDHNTSINELSETIEKDQAIVSKILRLVNSAFYGVRSHISNVPHAMILLGFNTVRNAVIAISVIGTFSGKETFPGFSIKDFWKHSVAVAVTSRWLAEQSRLEPPDDCFVAGLLHDVGKVVLIQYFKELFGQIWALTQEENLSFYESEKKTSPVTHAQIGGHLTKKWDLPASLTDTITYHHALNENATNFNLLVIVHVADIIVNAKSTGLENADLFSKVHPEAAKIMNPQLTTVSDWFPALEDEIESACAFFLEDVK